MCGIWSDPVTPAKGKITCPFLFVFFQIDFVDML